MAKDEPKQQKVPRVDTQRVVDWGEICGYKEVVIRERLSQREGTGISPGHHEHWGAGPEPRTDPKAIDIAHKAGMTKGTFLPTTI